MRQLEWRQIRSHLDRLDDLSKLSTAPNPPTEDNKQIILSVLYRRSTNSERLLLAADPADESKYSTFLAQPGTGLIKLVRDFGCDEYSALPRNEQICRQFSMPGGGAAFSFRQADYQYWNLADLLYDGKSLIAFGQMSLGFLLDVGPVPVEKVRLDAAELNFLTSFTPAVDIEEAAKQNTALADGVCLNGSLFKKFLPVVVGDTYVMRSVAYKGKVPREHFEIKYNELELDRRRDIIVAFQLLHRDFNGTATILWKVLETKSSPELKSNKK